LQLESLEFRYLLANITGDESGAPCTFDRMAASGAFVFNADASASHLGLSLDSTGQTVQITQDGELVVERALSTLTELTINGNSLDNTLTLNLANGNPIPSRGLFYNGGDEATETGDAIQIVGGEAFETSYTPTVDRDGIITLTPAGSPAGALTTIYFTSLEPVQDNVPNSNLTVNGTSAGNAIGYANGPGSSIFLGDTTGLVAVDNFETSEFSNKANLILNGDAGDDVVTLNAAVRPTGLTALIVNGGDNNDVVNLLAANVPNLTIDGNAGMNAARIADAGPGVFDSGNINLLNTALEFEFGGTTPGFGAGFHDLLNVMGTVTIGSNVTLVANAFADGQGINFVPADGDQFVIINNDGGDAVMGTFAGLAEGSLLSSNFLGSGLNARLTYRGGTNNNDVVIVVDGSPAISGTVADQMVNDDATIAPFSGVAITAAMQVLTVTLSLSGGDTNGILANLGGFNTIGPGTYQLTGATAAVATAAVQALVFDPTDNQVAPGQNVTTTFTIAVDDGRNPAVADALTTVIASSINDAPLASDLSASAVEDGPAVAVSFNADDIDTDDDPTTLTYTILSPPAEGSLTGIVGNTFTFDPGTGFQDLTVGETRAVTFTYTAADGNGTTSNTATGTITVIGVNDAPSFTLAADPIVPEDAGLQTIMGLASAISPGIGDAGQTLTFNVVVTGTTGNLAFDTSPVFDAMTGDLTFTAAGDTNGIATVEVTLQDNGSTSGPLAVDIPLEPGGGIIDGDTFTIDDGVTPPKTFEFNSNDAFDPTNVEIRFSAASTVDSIANDIVNAIANSGLALAPANVGGGRVLLAGSSDNVAVDVSMSNLTLFNSTGGANSSATQTFRINVTAVNDAPVLTPTGTQMLTATDEDTTSPSDLVSAIVAATISDVDAGAIEGIAITTTTGKGTWQISTDGGANFSAIGTVSTTQALLLRAADVIRYAPDQLNGETATITYRAWDQTGTTFGQQGFKVNVAVAGGSSPFSVNADTASILVSDVNDAPVLAAIGNKTVDELTTLSFLATASDADVPANTLTFSLSGVVPAGASITPAGAFSWTPTAAQGPGVYTFDVVVTDNGTPNLSDRETITVTVNDSGTLTVEDVSAAEGGGLTFTVRLDNAVQGGFTVDVTLADVTATGGTAPLVFPADYNNVVARLNYNGTAGETHQFTVATLNDAVVEDVETFTVRLNASNPLVDDRDTATGTIIDNDSLLVEFNQATGMDTESAGGNLPQLLVTGTIQIGHRVTINLSVLDATATGGGVDYTATTSVTIPAGSYDAAVVFTTSLLSINPDTLIESDETIDLGSLTGSQVQVGDANADGTIQATTRYTIIDDEMPRTAVVADTPTTLSIRDVVPGGKDDRLALTIVSGMLVVTDLNSLLGDYTDNTTGNVVETPLASFNSIEIDLLGGNDQVAIDFGGASLGFTISVRINGGDGIDTLTFSGPTPLGAGGLTTNDDVDDIFVNGSITTQGGSVTLKAARDLEVNANINTGLGGSVSLTANGHDIFGNCSLIQAGNANINLVAGTGIAGVRVQTTGDVTLDAGSGGIVGCSGQVTVSAQTLTTLAGASVGIAFLASGHVSNVEPILTHVDAIQGTVGGLGIFLVNDRPLTDNVVLVDSAPLGVRDVRVVPPRIAPEGERSPLQNGANRLDVNDDGAVSPVDALAVINYLTSPVPAAHSESSNDTHVRFYVDVNGDRTVSPLDALIVINQLNSRPTRFAEGESQSDGDARWTIYAQLRLDDNRSRTDSQLGERSKPLAKVEIEETWRAGTGSPSVVPSSYSSSRLEQNWIDDENIAQDWESLLAAIAEDAVWVRQT
jgi:VCBS repeat-containing protein